MERLIKKINAAISGKLFYLILGVILLIALAFRTVCLEADPPMGITKSQDFSTDPFQYVYFAKNTVDLGVANPYHDPRFSQWEKSSQNLLALIVFNIMGTGRWQGNFVGVIFNLASIWLLALALKNFGSRLAGLLFAIIASFDFTLAWFARTPFLEAAQNFWLCGSVYLFSRRRDHWLYYAAAGLACAAAAFFGKMIALFMLGSFALVWVLLYFNDAEERRATLTSALRFGAGFAVGALAWLLIIYLPSRGQFSGYLSEQAVGLYGAPKALDSINDFVWQMISLLWEHDFFLKMPLVTILGFLFGAGVLTTFTRKHPGKKFFGDFNVGWVLLFTWFAIGYIALFPWNYRPLRYQTSLMFPMMAMTAVALAFAFDYLCRHAPAMSKSKHQESNKPGHPALLAGFWALWLVRPLTLLLLWIGSLGGGDLAAKVKQGPTPYVLALLIVGAVVALIYRALPRLSRQAVSTCVLISGAIIIFLILFNTVKFVDWAGSRQYSLTTADRDLDAILNQGAVISGPYGPALTQENSFSSVIHMFGVKQADKQLFDKYPITHLAMDEGNEKRAREDYAEMMNRAVFLTRYIIRGMPVRLYRISSATGNAQANQYTPTDYETSLAFAIQRNNDSATVYLQRFLDRDKPNYSANLYAADALYSGGQYPEALGLYRNAQQFSPGDPLSARGLGNSFLASVGSNTAYADSALHYLKIARHLFVQDNKLAETITNLERRKQ